MTPARCPTIQQNSDTINQDIASGPHQVKSPVPRDGPPAPTLDLDHKWQVSRLPTTSVQLVYKLKVPMSSFPLDSMFLQIAHRTERNTYACVCVCAQSLSRVWLFATPWTVAPRLLCPQGFLGKNIGEGCQFLFHLLDPGITPVSPASQADSLPTELSGKPSCTTVPP